MANQPIRFRASQGLERGPDESTQGGLLRLEDADLELRDVIQKRRGAAEVGLARSGTPGDDIPASAPHAIWYRGNEALIEAEGRLYSRRECSAGDWADVGPWHRCQSRERPGVLGELGPPDTLLSCAAAEIAGCRLETYEQAVGASVRGRFVADTVESDFELDADGSDAKIAALNATTAVAFWVRDEAGTGTLQRSEWTPPAAMAAPTQVVASAVFDPGVSPKTWDVHGSEERDVWAAVWYESTTDRRIRVQQTSGAAQELNFGATTFDDLASRAISVYVDPRVPAAGTDHVTVYAVVGGHTIALANHAVQVAQFDYDKALNTLTQTGFRATFIGTSTIRAAAVGADTTDTNACYAAVESQDGTDFAVTSLRRFLFSGAPAATLVETHFATQIVGQSTPVRDEPAAVLAPTGNPPHILREVQLLYGLRTQEIVARSWIGQTRSQDDRDLRILTPTSTIHRHASAVHSWSVPGRVTPGAGAAPTLAAITRIDSDERPNCPANIDDTAVSAFAGLPKVWDGFAAYEQDWHSLPEIKALTPTVGGSLTTPETYLVAITWEWTDQRGTVYRSAPTVDTVTLPVGQQSFDVVFYAGLITERPGDLLAVIWVTVPGASGTGSPRRTAEILINTSTTETETFNVQAVLEDAEALDLDLIGGVQARVTDFVAVAGGRLWSRDTLFGSVARHSLFGVTGEGRSWDSVGVVQFDGAPQEDLTTVQDLDGTVLLASRNAWWRVRGEGPGNTGVGAYAPPVLVPSEIGPTDHCQVSLTPEGLAYGTPEGPCLLTRGLDVRDIGTQVMRQYEIESGVLVGVLYDPRRKEVIWGDSTEPTLRWSLSTNRWGSDTGRTMRDLGRGTDGEIAILASDGRVLVQDPDDRVFGDGATAYTTVLGTPWIREPTRGEKRFSSFRILEFVLQGEFEGDHDLTVERYANLETTPRQTWTVPAATIAANIAAGLPYIYRVRPTNESVFATRFVVTDDARSALTYRIAGLDIQWEGDGSSDTAEIPPALEMPEV